MLPQSLFNKTHSGEAGAEHEQNNRNKEWALPVVRGR